MAGYVYIIESPSPRDLSDGRTEGNALCETFKLAGIKHSYSLAVNLDEFLRALALGEGLPFLDAYRKHGEEAPVLHLSMHGNTDGVQLTDGRILSWDDLRDILSPINSALPLGLMVTFSTCGGAASIRMSMSEDVNHKPFYVTVGSTREVPWDEALIAYAVFYHNWFRELPAMECVKLMKAASGHSGFAAYSGAEQKQDFIEFAQKQRLIEALSRPGS